MATSNQRDIPKDKAHYIKAHLTDDYPSESHNHAPAYYLAFEDKIP